MEAVGESLYDVERLPAKTAARSSTRPHLDMVSQLGNTDLFLISIGFFRFFVQRRGVYHPTQFGRVSSTGKNDLKNNYVGDV